MNDKPTTTGKLIASCGHEVTDIVSLVDIRYGDTDCDAYSGFHRVVMHGSWCQSCADKWRASGDLIETDEQEKAWFATAP